jgi:uncharacterized protein (DUF2336 family)
MSSLFDDMKALKTSPNAESRKTIAQKIAEFFNKGMFDKSEELVSTEILRLLAKDTEVRIRQILSENLKKNSRLAHDIALTLAQDIATVSNPMLEFSTVLTEDDLIAIVESTEEAQRLLAIARRAQVPENLSMALIDKHQGEVTQQIVTNEGAVISKEGYEHIIEDFADDEKMLENLVHYGKLPLSVSEKLIGMVSDSLRQELEDKYHLNSQDIDDIVADTMEDSLLEMLASEGGTMQAKDLAKHLDRNDKLTNSIILRGLCHGHLDFFEAGIAELSGIPYENAHQLIHGGTEKAFEALYHKAGIPEQTAKGMYQVLGIILQEEKAHTLRDEAFNERVTAKLKNGYYPDIAPIMQYIIALVETGKKKGRKKR